MEKKKRKKEIKTYYAKANGFSYKQLEEGTKSFLVVPDDRPNPYKIEDILIISQQIWITTGTVKDTGGSITRIIECVQRTGKGLMQGFVILGLKKPEEKAEVPPTLEPDV